jgi:ABC-type Fe3+/spermidine/putrescine transport system ATPase subunit
MNELRIKNLRVSYGENVVLDDFSFEAKKGEMIVVLGPSGCGKSTLLTAISGLKNPIAGSIEYNEEILYSKKKAVNVPTELRNVGFVFQSYALWPHMSVYQNISLPLKARKNKKDQIKKKVDAILEIVHMQEYKDRYPEEISGGEQQRIALARSLVYEPSLLLLDEPLANIDANLKTKLIQEIKDIQKKLGITTLYVTHDQQEAFEIADQIIIMSKGKIMQTGTPKEIYNHSDNIFVAKFIGENNIFNPREENCPCFLKNNCRRQAITIRPEDIEIKENGEHIGTIKKIHYKGNHTEYVVNSYGHKLIIHAQQELDNKVGDMISFTIKKYQEV